MSHFWLESMLSPQHLIQKTHNLFYILLLLHIILSNRLSEMHLHFTNHNHILIYLMGLKEFKVTTFNVISENLINLVFKACSNSFIFIALVKQSIDKCFLVPQNNKQQNNLKYIL